jgi:hypothetical protein
LAKLRYRYDFEEVDVNRNEAGVYGHLDAVGYKVVVKVCLDCGRTQVSVWIVLYKRMMPDLHFKTEPNPRLRSGRRSLSSS